MTTSGVNADDISRLWLNPASRGGGESTADITTRITDFNPSATVGDMNLFGSFLVRMLATGTTSNIPGVNGITIDELRFGTTFAEVTDAMPQTFWNTTTSPGDWSTSGNWTGGAPSGASAIATFGSKITAPQTVNVDSPQIVSALNFNNANSYTLA